MDQFISFSSISAKSQIDSVKESLNSDSTFVLYSSPNKTFTITFNSISDSIEKSLIVNNQNFYTKQKHIELDITNKNYKNSIMIIKIKSSDIDLKSISISNIMSSGGFPVTLN
jgi:hypothetical protein